jgi:hypothetical protein
VTVLDLPQQIALLREALAGKPGAARIDGVAVDLLAPAETAGTAGAAEAAEAAGAAGTAGEEVATGAVTLPGEADVWWMSQFLDCFGEEQIVNILSLVRRSMKPGARACILEPFCDRQRFPAAELSLNAGSLYFTCMANGNSRFYRAEAFLPLVKRAGFLIEEEMDDIGTGGHTLLICSAR